MMKEKWIHIREWAGHYPWKRIFTLGLLIAIVGSSHAITPITSSNHLIHSFHVIFNKLFFVPILLGAIWFEMRGAVITALLVSVVFLPHIFIQWAGHIGENINQVGEIVTYWVTALVTGLFVKLEKTALRDVAETHEGSLIALVAALDAREHETELHSLRVRAYSLRIADQLALDKQERTILSRAALLHDIGKIGISDTILLKEGPLDQAQWQVMKQHPDIGYRLLQSVPFLRQAAETVYCHHEKYDGSGYPRGLEGEKVPFLSRIFAVADVFDALTSDRPYHKKISHQDALDVLVDGSGTHFDPCVVKAFRKIPLDEWNRIDRQILHDSVKI